MNIRAPSSPAPLDSRDRLRTCGLAFVETHRTGAGNGSTMTSNTNAEITNKSVALLVTVSLDPERRRLT